MKFPAYPTPHMEAYTAAGVYNAFVDSSGALSYAKACRTAADLPARWSSTKRTTITTTMVVQCRLPAVAELKASKVGTGGLMVVTAGHTTNLVVLGNLKTTGSTLTFDKRYCHAAAPPAQATPKKYAFTGMSASFSLGAAPVVYTIAGEVCGDPATDPVDDHDDDQRPGRAAEDGGRPGRDRDGRCRDRPQGLGRQRARPRDVATDLRPRTAAADEPGRRRKQCQRHEYPGHRHPSGSHRHAGRVLLVG